MREALILIMAFSGVLAAAFGFQTLAEVDTKNSPSFERRVQILLSLGALAGSLALFVTAMRFFKVWWRLP